MTNEEADENERVFLEVCRHDLSLLNKEQSVSKMPGYARDEGPRTAEELLKAKQQQERR